MYIYIYIHVCLYIHTYIRVAWPMLTSKGHFLHRRRYLRSAGTPQGLFVCLLFRLLTILFLQAKFLETLGPLGDFFLKWAINKQPIREGHPFAPEGYALPGPPPKDCICACMHFQRLKDASNLTHAISLQALEIWKS